MTDRIHLYSWTDGYKPGVKAEAAARELKRIESEYMEPVTPAVLVEASRTPDALLHGIFEWDDNKAAEKYRLVQANRIITSLRVVVKEGDPPSPALVSMKADEEGSESKRNYVSMVDVSRDDEKRRQFLMREVQRISAYLDRSNGFSEMAPLRKAVAQVRRSLDRQTLSASAAD